MASRRCTTAWLATIGVLASGCATLTRDPVQHVRIEAFDDLDRAVTGLACRVGPDGVAATLPAADVPVTRSSARLEIECRRGLNVATATVLPRRDGLEQALVPFGSLAVFVDHVSGKLYEYPTVLRLRLGRHVTLEHGGESRIAQSEPLPGAPTIAASSAPPASAAPRRNMVASAAAPKRPRASAPPTW